MREYALDLLRRFKEAVISLVPIVVIVAVFQGFVIRAVPADLTTLLGGMAVVAIGIAVFLQGLDLSVFPLGKSLASQFTRRRAFVSLLAFGFCIGAAAVIAEPALIAVADQAQMVSGGRINALTLRILIAVSVGSVIVLGIVRAVAGWRIHWFVIVGYITVILVTYVAPAEVVGLAYDSGGVTTNIVTVPLIAAIGLGLAGSLQDRSALVHGFGLVALAVMVPMITVQIYGMVVYRNRGEAPVAPPSDMAAEAVQLIGVGDLLGGLAGMLGDVALLVVVVLVFQLLVLRRGVPRPGRVAVGFALVVIGLYAFVVGLKLGLLPLGTLMAEQLIARDLPALILAFAFLIGFATTLAEPALIAIGEQAQQAAPGRIRARAIRGLVALGVGVGIMVGVYRILAGDPLHLYVMAGYSLVILLTVLAPTPIVALAFDLGGVTTSEITVPVVTALGIGLAMGVEGRDPLIDGFGLIAFASLFPIISVLSYAIIQDRLHRRSVR